MQDEFVNRLGMFRTALGTLNDPANQPVWSGQPPVIFTTKMTQAATAVTELEAFVAQQQVVITRRETAQAYFVRSTVRAVPVN